MSVNLLDNVLPKIPSAKQQSNGEYLALCPAHDDHSPSLSITTGDDGRVLFNCFAHCSFEMICAAAGIDPADCFPPKPKKEKSSTPRRMVEYYDYHDANGKLYYRVERWEPGKNGRAKEFPKKRPVITNNKAEWDYKDVAKHVDFILYRLPRVIEAVKQGKPIFVAEGERKVNTLEKWGFAATCNTDGAITHTDKNKWPARHTETLTGADVIILPDNDDTGKTHAQAVATRLHGKAARIRIVELPGLKQKGDIVDWVKLGHTKEELEKLVSEAPDWVPGSDNLILSLTSNLPIIRADCGDHRVTTAQAWDAIIAANNPPKYFRYANKSVRLVTGDEGNLILDELDAYKLGYELKRVANWVKEDSQGNETITGPSYAAVMDVLSVPDPKLPVITRITEVPVFAADGSISKDPGYHASAKVYYDPAEGIDVKPLPDIPSDEDIAKARDLIYELIHDFQFVSDADKCHAISLLLLPFARNLISGPTPNHLIEAPTAGTGKSLLASMLIYPSCGNRTGMMTQANNDEEWGKKITAALKSARPVIVIDNVTKTLDSGKLASAITDDIWSDRILGKSETIEIPVRCAWVTTANNPTMSQEITRRTIRIRIDPKMDRPWLRESFKHPDLPVWVEKNRSELIWSALVIIKSWIANGMPLSSCKPLGSYHKWTYVMGGILQNAGIPGFLQNINEFYEVADAEGALWRTFTEEWYQRFDSEVVSVSDLFPIADELEIFDFGQGSPKSQKIIFGKLLGKQRDKVIGDYKITPAGKKQRAQMWRLLRAESQLFNPDDDQVNKVNVVNVYECSLTPRVNSSDFNEEEKTEIFSSEVENIHEYSQHSPDLKDIDELMTVDLEEFEV